MSARKTTAAGGEAFRVRRDEKGRLALSGVIDESADLGFIASLSGHTRFNMREVRRVNSYGVRAWIEAVRRLPPDATLELEECPPQVIDQINMVAGFVGRGTVTSFYAPMLCERCGHERDQLFTVAELRAGGKLPPVACPQCGATMVVDDLEEQYLLFARE
jgi:hypothetical protein